MSHTKWPHEYPLLPGELTAFKIRPYPPILEWAEKYLNLVSPGYTQPGPFRARHWQKEIINASMYWNNVYEVGATQVGKSTTADIAMYYYMSVFGVNGIVCYANGSTVEDVFKLRIKDMIYYNKCMRENWSGVDDDLTISNIKLRNCIWRVASAQNKNDLATFAAAIVIGSEVSKWQKQDWNPVLMLRGRQGAFNYTGEYKTILESSPFEIGDYLYKEVFKPGNILVTPHYKCPHCNHWQEFTDSQIKVRDKDKCSPEYIRATGEKAVFYECISCRQEITEAQRAVIDKDVIWAAPTIEKDDFSQKPEKIYADGTIKSVAPGGFRAGFDSITYVFNRLVDITFPFYKCLALFFETKDDPQAHRTYENETMARWKKRQSRKLEINYLESKRGDYYQYGERHRIPADVKVLTIGIDTQDSGFYYAIFGWGFGMTCWLVRHDFIKLPIDPNQNHQDTYIKFRQSLQAEPLLWQDGSEADFRFGLIDRGGHRAEDVDYICSHYPNLKPYIGMQKPDDKKDVIFKSNNGEWFMGQPEMLSDYTGTLLESDTMQFPSDVQHDFLDQIWRQFRDYRISRAGIREERWIHGYLGPDHYRDCFNLAWGAAKYMKLDKILFNKDMTDTIKPFTKTDALEQQLPREPVAAPQQSIRYRNGGYFHRALGRGRR
jgi:phage terminase large subunit GpA-like protein